MQKITHIVFDHDGTLVNTMNIEPVLFPGILDLLKFLKEKKIKMYVWTARNNASTKRILSSLNLLEYFEDICGGDNATSKPSPAGIEYLVKDTACENVVVIGDSLGDILGGHEFGAHCIGACWGHGEASADSAYKEVGAKASFLEVSECQNYLEKLI